MRRIRPDEAAPTAGEVQPTPDLQSRTLLNLLPPQRHQDIEVGCSYYVAQSEKLYFMEDVTFGRAENIDMCKAASP